MKKLNNRAFTLVELLTVITILGILAIVSVGAVFKYLTSSKQQAMETIASSSYDGMVMYMMDNNIMLEADETKTLTIEELYNDHRIDRPIDPYDNKTVCSGEVTVINKTTSLTAGLEDYQYTVIVNCSGDHSVEQTYPKK